MDEKCCIKVGFNIAALSTKNMFTVSFSAMNDLSMWKLVHNKLQYVIYSALAPGEGIVSITIHLT